MCGIAGVVSSSPVAAATGEKMRDLLAHRGPDHAGLWSSAGGRVRLANRRLAIIDLSPEANQPFVSGDGRYAITFNGEIYNFREVRRELEKEGVQFRTSSDTEVVVEAWRRFGVEALDRLSGMFAFAIWDERDRRLFCARDRAGEKPLYYAEFSGAFLFASELKAIVSYPAFPRRLDMTAVADFFTLGFVADPKSIWQDSRKLPPGQWLEVSLEGVCARIVRGPEAWGDWRLAPDRRVRDWRPEVLATLEKAAAETSVADVPVGAFLSGGVDSSSVVAALSRGGRHVRSFTIGFPQDSHDERPYAREVAALYGTDHTERLVEPGDVPAVWEKLLWHYDEPTGDYSYLPTYYVCREAREHVKVALSGDGGDEAFAGYRKYQRIALRAGLEAAMRPFVASAIRAAADAVLPERSPRRRTASQYTASAPEMLFDMLNVGLALPEMARIARGQFAAALRDYSPVSVVSGHLSKAPPKEVGLVNAMRYLDLKLTLAGDILAKVDRASMAVSLEARSVYVHRDLLELAARVPPEELASRREAKRVLKSALTAWLPPRILRRRKMGFAMPLKSWFSKTSGGGDGILADRSTGPLDELIDPGARRELEREIENGPSDRSAVLFAFRFLADWLWKWE